jgi:hypothetical protein
MASSLHLLQLSTQVEYTTTHHRGRAALVDVDALHGRAPSALPQRLDGALYNERLMRSIATLSVSSLTANLPAAAWDTITAV